MPPGKHRLQVLADCDVSQGESDPVTVTLPGEEERRPRLIVLAVGVGAFSNEGVRRLPKADGDALAIEKVFQTHSKDKGLFREVIVKCVTNDKGGRREVLRALRWFSEEMTAEDVGVFFFAGHGKRDKTGQLYLYGHDIDPAELVETGIPGSQLKATLAATKGRRILLLDACYAGAIHEKERSDRDSLNEELARDLGKIENGLIVFCSSRGDEESKEDVRNGGYFTQAVVEGLSGKAHLVDGAVYLSHLRPYVSDRVKALSKNGQTPTFNIPPGITRLPLSKPVSPSQECRMPVADFPNPLGLPQRAEGETVAAWRARLLEDQATRWHDGQPLHVEDYLGHLPELAGERDAILDLIAHERLLRREGGEHPTANEYALRSPDLADDIRAHFALEDELDGLNIGTPLHPPSHAQRGPMCQRSFRSFISLGRAAAARFGKHRTPCSAARSLSRYRPPITTTLWRGSCFPERGEGCRRSQPSAYLPDLRSGRTGAALSRPGVRAGRFASGSPGSPGNAAHFGSRPDRESRGSGPAPLPREKVDPPRPQAGEHQVAERGQRQGPRLRPGSARGAGR